MSLPTDVVRTIEGYGYMISFQNLWDHFCIDEILCAHGSIPLSIAVQFEHQSLLWHRVRDHREFLFSQFQSDISQLDVPRQVAHILLELYVKYPRAAMVVYHEIIQNAHVDF